MSVDEKINELLATKVMGWHLQAGLWKDEDNNTMFNAYAGDWHPTENVSQVLMCAEKFCDDAGCMLQINYFYTEVWQVRIWNEVSLLETDADIEAISDDKELSIAITEALIEAMGGIDEDC